MTEQHKKIKKRDNIKAKLITELLSDLNLDKGKYFLKLCTNLKTPGNKYNSNHRLKVTVFDLLEAL
ncbi:MAG: hypothetical protein V3V41_07985 [Candidatus Heimdallarchaeota archaeon]